MPLYHHENETLRKDFIPVKTYLLIFAMLVLPGCLAAQSRLMDPRMIYVIDGDTIRYDRESIRLMGFNTPETRFAKCEKERVQGYLAKERLRQLLDGGKRITLDLEKKRDGLPRRDRYKRLLGTLYVGGEDVANIMIREGHAEAYDGGKRRDWCAA